MEKCCEIFFAFSWHMSHVTYSFAESEWVTRFPSFFPCPTLTFREENPNAIFNKRRFFRWHSFFDDCKPNPILIVTMMMNVQAAFLFHVSGAQFGIWKECNSLIGGFFFVCVRGGRSANLEVLPLAALNGKSANFIREKCHPKGL